MRPRPGPATYVVDEKARAITVTDEGWEKIEELLGIGNIADPENWDLKHHVEVAIKAHNLYKRDVEYVVKDGEVIIVDEFTGRLMPGRRWSDGLHQAVEAKEGVAIRKEDQTLATITFQNYFRMYKKLSGMTGTAETEAAEFDKIYKLEIVVIPTNRQMLRIENPDVVYRTAKEKYFAVADEITRLHEAKQPVLVGTTSDREVRAALRDSEAQGRPPRRAEREVPREGSRDRRAGRTPRHGDDCDQHGRPRYRHSARRQLRVHGAAGPGEEVSRRAPSPRPREPSRPIAGPGMLRFYYQSRSSRRRRRPGTRRLRRTPGAAQKEHEAVIAAGGLHILGTERHESRRVDNQLRGRAGRQGDPGASRFYPLARRRPDAHLRARVGLHPAAAAGHGRGRADREPA